MARHSIKGFDWIAGWAPAGFLGFGLAVGISLALACFTLHCYAGTNQKVVPSVSLEIRPNPSKRVLVFPRDYNVGEILISPDAYSTPEKSLTGPAQGTVVVPAGKFVTFIPGRRFFQNPKVINNLPVDGIDCVEINFFSMADSEDGLCDKAVLLLSHLKGLQKLDLDKSETSDNALACVKDMPNLQMISGFETVFEGKFFKQLANLQQLHIVRMPCSNITEESIAYISCLPHLRSLNLAHSNITDQGVKNLAACKELIYLNLEDNPKITDKSIKSLLGLKSLRNLIVGNTAMTNPGVLQLKDLPLAELTIPRFVHTDKQMEAIHKALPGVLLSLPRGGDHSVDPETKTIYAPLH